MADDENRSRLFDEIRNFSQRKLKKVETKVVTGSGEQLTEKRSPKGLQQVKSHGITSPGYVADYKPDLQVGMIIPGLFISSQDVAQDKSLLETYEITHILNLAPGVENAFEDDYNYKKIEILDLPETDITQYFDECIEFIHEGIQRGNCLVHCNAGVSRSTTICCAYLMKQKKMKYKEALASIREARAFAKPNEGFAKQLEQYDDQLFGQMAPPDSSEDKFMARKRAEIEAEKAAILGRSSVKNTLKSFGAHLDSVIGQKLQSITPIKLPVKKKPASNTTTPAAQAKNNQKKSLPNNVTAPPPPPPPPAGNILDKKLGPAPPPPPPPPNNIFDDKQKKSLANKANKTSSKVKPVADVKSTNAQISNANQENNNEHRQSAKSEFVDETPIKVSAQKKLWETANNQQKQEKQEKISSKKKNISTTPAVVQPPASNIVKANKIGTWERAAPAPEPNRTLTASPVTSSPEPKKKIIIKKKDANNNVIGSNEPRRSTRDLAAALEAAASESNSSTPYSSPGPQRRQMQYGKRASTQTIPNDSNKATVARKPMWGLRDQVDNLLESTPTSTPTRCRSPALIQTQQQRDFSHSPSPQPGANAAGQKSSKMVFGRVPPRKTSLSGAGNMVESNTNDSNDLPVVCAPITTTTNDTISRKTSSKSKTKEPELSATTNKKPTNNTNTNNTSNGQPTKTTSNNVSKKTDIKKNDTTKTNTDDNIRAGFKKVPLSETKDSGPSSTNAKDTNEKVPKEKSTNQSIEARRKSRGLNRSSTAKILNLIKTKSKADFGKSMETVDEDVEIEFLLNQLDETGLENIDWDEIGIDENEIKEIVDKNQDEEESESQSDDEESEETETETSDEESDEEDSDDEMEHTVFKPIAPPLATNVSNVDNKTKPKPVNNLMQPKITSTATLTLKPVDKSANKFIANNTGHTKLEVSESEETESD